jgi:hypothetical protein
MLLIGPAQSRNVFGLAGANPAVSGLQQSLKSLAQISGRPNIDPGTVDGVVGIRTMSAIVAAFGIISDKLPSEARYALQVGLIVGGQTTQARDLVTRYASQLDMAVKAAILKLAQGGGAIPTPQTPAINQPVSPPAPQPNAAVSFLKTPFGMIAAAIGVVGGGLLLFSLVSK